MYKVFINNKCLFLVNENNSGITANANIFNFTNEDTLLKTIDNFEKDKKQDTLYVSGEPDKILSLLPIIVASGGLVLKGEDKILFIYRYGKWDLPKGKAEEGETPQETALREVTEETGVKGLKIIKELTPTYHSYKLGMNRIIKKTHWFEMTYTDDSQILPQAIEDISIVKWLNKKDIPWAMRDSYASIIELLTNSGYL